METTTYNPPELTRLKPVEIPVQAITSANELLCAAIDAKATGSLNEIVGNPYAGNPGLIDVLSKLANQEVFYDAAEAFAIINVADQIADADDAYASIRQGIVQAHRDITDFINR